MRTRAISLGLICLALLSACKRGRGASQPEVELEEREDFACTPCGCWRWPPKTASDTTVNTVNATVQDTTIGALGALPAPSTVNTGISTRYQPPTTSAEITTWRLKNVTLQQFKLEPDSDVHLAIVDPADASKTMIAEIPDGQNCVSSSSPYLAQIKAARATFAARCNATGSYQTPAQGCSVAGSDVVTLTGIGLFDELHGATDAAPNGLELHPVISICFGRDCSGATGGGSYSVGGTISGLAGGGLQLKNGADTLTPAAGTSSFAFPTKVQTGGSYSASITAQPTSPWQSCGISNPSGSVGTADVTSIAVACTTNRYSIAAQVSGLLGSGLSLQNGADSAGVATNGTISFPTQVASGQPFAVTASQQPLGPSQTCTVSGGSGTVSNANVTATVSCATNSFTLGGRVVALAAAGLQLQNGADVIDVSSGATSFAMPTKVLSGAAYTISIARQPTGLTCSLSGGSGTVGAGDVTTAVVNCGSSFTIGGTVQGLLGTVALTNNGGDELLVSGNGSFAFDTPIASGNPYLVAVSHQPGSPVQTCTVANSSGTVGSQNVTNVQITCATASYTLGGTVAGLTGSGLVLQNGDAQVSVPANATRFAFATKVASDSGYSVRVATQPSSPSQTCTVTNGSGVVGSADVNNVAVNCVTNRYRIGGTVTGLTGDGLLLTNGADQVEVNGGSQTFQFANTVPSGGSYSVAVAREPVAPSQTCALSGAVGVVGSSDVSMSLTCADTPDADAGACPPGQHRDAGVCAPLGIGPPDSVKGCASAGAGWAGIFALAAAASLLRRRRPSESDSL